MFNFFVIPTTSTVIPSHLISRDALELANRVTTYSYTHFIWYPWSLMEYVQVVLP